MHLAVVEVGFGYPRARGDALTSVSFSAGPGVTAVVGVNGAGKSTLMKIAARILSPARGTVVLDGIDVHRARRGAIAPRIAHMPQELVLPAGARLLDSVAYLGWLRGVPSSTAIARSMAALDRVSLADRAQDRVSTLSGGMVRRLALAQALVSEPDLLLLDEPTTGLDPEQRVGIRELLAEPGVRAPVTLVSSHLMEDVETVADQVVMLDEGAVGFSGSLADFRCRPDGVTESAEAAFLRRLVAGRGTA